MMLIRLRSMRFVETSRTWVPHKLSEENEGVSKLPATEQPATNYKGGLEMVSGDQYEAQKRMAGYLKETHKPRIMQDLHTKRL